MKWLHHIADYSSLSSVIVCCSCYHYNSLLSGSFVYAMHLGGSWFSFMPSVTCNENIPLKHQIPVNTSLYSFCNFLVALATMWASLSGSAIKLSIPCLSLLPCCRFWNFCLFWTCHFVHLSVYHANYRAWYCSWCSVVVASHSLADLTKLAHFLALQRSYIGTEWPCKLFPHICPYVVYMSCCVHDILLSCPWIYLNWQFLCLVNCSKLFSVYFSCLLPACTSAYSVQGISSPTPHAVSHICLTSVGFMHGCTVFAVSLVFVCIFLCVTIGTFKFAWFPYQIRIFVSLGCI